MDCVILLRNPSNGKVLSLTDDDDNMAVFSDMDEAVETASEHMLCKAWPYQIVELDEL